MMLSDSITVVGKLAFCAAANHSAGSHTPPPQPHHPLLSHKFTTPSVSHVSFIFPR
jgi:hypothetical protein